MTIAIVGAGPAGMAAAVAARAAASPPRVVVLDDNAAAGGQIWRGSESASPWQSRFRACGAELLTGRRVTGLVDVNTLAVEGAGELRFDRLILCTGARERFLPFPGWTLPGVMGAGGLQAMVKGGLPVAGKRVVVAGTGPLLLAVAAGLRRAGARVVAVAEQAPAARVRGFARWLLRRQPAKVAQGALLRFALLGSGVRAGAWVERAEGDGRLEAVTLAPKGRRIACDYLACGFGLVPNLELAALCECRLDGGTVAIDRWQQTSRPGVYAAGEITGVGGAEAAVVEGRIAGLAATGRQDEAAKLFAARDRALRFRRALESAFALRGELASLAQPDTIVCRCEDVRLGQLQDHRSWRAAKLQTRCGMGPCQGRVCGPAVEFLLGWPAESVRPPLFPVRVSELAQRERQPL